MLEQLFKYRGVLARHRAAPRLEERERYLTHRATQGSAHTTLTYLASKLLIIAPAIPLRGEDRIAVDDIERAAVRSIEPGQDRPCREDSRAPRRVFIRMATEWLRFLDRLQAPAVKVTAFTPQIAAFSVARRDEHGLALKTVHTDEWFIGQFCDWFDGQHRPFAAVRVDDVDTFLAERGQRGCRVSVATAAQALRTFFRYAECPQWCRAGIAAAIESPRLFQQETLPGGPDWSVVPELIAQTDTDQARDIRDRAIVMLLAIYGRRSGEVAPLEIEPLDGSTQRLTVRRSKQRLTPEYPLIPALGRALAGYLKAVRPRRTRREVFLTLRAPVRPLSASALYPLTRTRLARLGYVGPHYGPPTRRHACAAHRVAQQLSLKAIGDHLSVSTIIDVLVFKLFAGP